MTGRAAVHRMLTELIDRPSPSAFASFADMIHRVDHSIEATHDTVSCSRPRC